VLEFSLLVAVWDGSTEVLGPVVAHDQLGGAHSWGIVLAAQSAGAVLGGLAMIRFRPRRLLLIGSLCTAPTSALLFALAVPLAVPVLAVAAFAAGVCIEVFEVNWATAMQQEIPPAALSRVSSYDALGSWGLAPVGTVLAGPLALALGTRAVLAAAGVLIVLLTAAVLCVPEVRQLRRRVPAASPGGERVH
jgi:MFS family permease